MPRKAGDISMPSDQRWPPAGRYLMTCTKSGRWTSPKQKTPAVMLTWTSPDGQFMFTDPVFVTGKAVARLNLVAQRVCGLAEETEIPDDDYEAAVKFANYILNNVDHKKAVVTVEVQKEVFIHEAGPMIGQKGERLRHRVAFGGYDRPGAVPVDQVPASVPPAATAPPADDDWPPASDDDGPPPADPGTPPFDAENDDGIPF